MRHCGVSRSPRVAMEAGGSWLWKALQYVPALGWVKN